MKPIFNTLIGLLLLLSSAFVHGQELEIHFSPAAPGGTVGQVITVDVVAGTFDAIAGMQFPILYDKNKLQFKTCKNLNPDLPAFIYNQATGNPPLCPGGGMPPCNSSIDNPVAGKIGLVWFDASGSGNYLDPNTVLFQIEFTVLAAGTSNIYIGPSAPPAINVFGPNNSMASFTYPIGAPTLNGFALIVPPDSVRVGERVCVPVQVHDLNNIVGMQFVVNWNSNVFNFSHVQNYNLPGLDCSQFNSTTPGRLSVNWIDVSGIGITLPNFTPIFDVCLTANGPNAVNGTTSNIACNGIGLPPTSPVSIENAAGANVWSEANSSIPGNILVSNTAQLENEILCFKADTLLVQSVGDSAAVTIRVNKFKNINQFQFVLGFDPAILGTNLPVLSSIAVPNNPLPAPAGGGKQYLAELIAGQPGKVKISWRASTQNNGATLSDGSALLVLKFPTNSATPGAFTPVTISGLSSVSPAITFQGQEKPNTFMANPNARTPNCPYLPCSEAGSVRMGAVAAVVVTLANKQDVSCFGNNIGAIDINVSGGATQAYTYKWSNNATTQDLTNIAAGTYTVTVTAGSATTTFTTAIAGPTAAISIPAANTTLTNVKCFGGNDGAISINPTGGTAPYTYSWPGGVTTKDRTGLTAGSYTVTVTDSKNCTFVPTAYNLTSPTVPMATTVSNIKNVRCLNDLNGQATLTTSGNQGNLSYVWKNASGTTVAANPPASPVNLAAGNYNVTVTDGNQCTTTVTGIAIAAPNSALNNDPITVTSPACAGQNNGSICINPFGGWGSYSAQWGTPVPGVGGLCPSGVASGSYNITITDAGGCAIARSVNVAQGADVAITNVTATDVVCYSQANGSISISLNSAFTSVNWTMNGSAAGSGTSISNLGPGTYIPTVNFGTGCSKTFPSVVINEPSALVATLVTMTKEDNGGDGALDISATGGTGTLTYSWAGPSGPLTATTQDLSGLVSGTYTVTVKDTKNCQTIQTFVVEKECQVCDATAIVTQNACASDGCFKVTVPAGATSPFILSWASSVNPTTQTQSFPAGEYALDICSLPAGLYNITITDATNQSYTMPSLSIGARPQVAVSITVTDPTENNKNGSISLTSGPGLPLSYEWISGNIMVPPNSLTSPVIFQLDSGEYCVRIKNLLPDGCEEVRCFELERLYPTLAPCGNAVSVNPTCVSSNNGSVQVFPQGGDNNFTYLWSNGSTTAKISNLASGTFTVTVTSGDGQTGVCGPYTLTTQSTLNITNVNETSDYNGFQVAGAGVCNGAASVVVAGTPVSFLWSNGVTTQNNNTLCGGTYTVLVTDQSGCTSSWTGDLTAPAALSASHTLVSQYNGFGVSCNGACDGSARVAVSGGVAPYVVKWPSGQTDLLTTAAGFSFENDLCGGNTKVVVTDANGVLTEYNITLTEPDPITITFADVAPASLATCNGEIIPTATGTTGDVTYIWYSQFHEGNGLRADGLCAEELVTFVVTDANGCSETARHEVPLPEGICFLANPVLTPNGDGDNDYFEIKCIHEVPNTVEIYDRWNQAVTPAFTNYQNNWDGKRGGVQVPEGVYFFVATFTDDQGNERSLKGYFNILY